MRGDWRGSSDNRRPPSFLFLVNFVINMFWLLIFGFACMVLGWLLLEDIINKAK